MDETKPNTRITLPVSLPEGVAPPEMTVGWDLDGSTLTGRVLDEVRATGANLLFKFGPQFGPQGPKGADPLYIGFKPSLRARGDIGEVEARILVHYFPHGIAADNLALTRLLLPGNEFPAEVNAVIGLTITQVSDTDSTHPWAPLTPGGFLIAFGSEQLIEISVHGLHFYHHRPDATEAKIQ